MMRALWTAGSGMKAQQLNVDVISNNLSNVNTTGYKKERVEFKDVLYETLDRAYVLGNLSKPVNLQVGHGAYPVATSKDFMIGNLERTDNNLDFAIEGDAFFQVDIGNEQRMFTRDGNFKVSLSEQGNKLTTADGNAILDSQGNPIVLDIDISKLNVSSDGALSYIDNTGATVDLGVKIGLFKFSNRNALENVGNNLYAQNAASGLPVVDLELGKPSQIRQGFIESSNVQVVEEMVKLIVAQRAYELNSKAIQTSDEMLGMANNLRR